jgi:hypothetical protein
MPSQRMTADQIRKNLTTANKSPTASTGRSISQNVIQSLARVRYVPSTSQFESVESALVLRAWMTSLMGFLFTRS